MNITRTSCLFYGLLIAAMFAGCTSIKSTLLHRDDGNNCWQKTSLKGVPITLKVPTHTKVVVKETKYLLIPENAERLDDAVLVEVIAQFLRNEAEKDPSKWTTITKPESEKFVDALMKQVCTSNAECIKTFGKLLPPSHDNFHAYAVFVVLKPGFRADVEAILTAFLNTAPARYLEVCVDGKCKTRIPVCYREFDREEIRTEKIFTVDFKRPAAGTLEYDATFSDQYFSKITSEIEDKTIEEISKAFERIFLAIQPLVPAKAAQPAATVVTPPSAVPAAKGAVDAAAARSEMLAKDELDTRRNAANGPIEIAKVALDELLTKELMSAALNSVIRLKSKSIEVKSVVAAEIFENDDPLFEENVRTFLNCHLCAPDCRTVTALGTPGQYGQIPPSPDDGDSAASPEFLAAPPADEYQFTR